MALAVGRVDVDRMLDEMSSDEFDEWVAFARVEPFGEEWRRTAAIVAEVRNAATVGLQPHMKRRLSQADMVSADDILGGKSSGNTMTPEQFEAMLSHGNHR